jgi:hypothetical protein
MSKSDKTQDDLKAMIKSHELIPLFSLIAILITVVTHIRRHTVHLTWSTLWVITRISMTS